MFHFDNSYLLLPEQCWTRIEPTPVAGPSLVALNIDLAGDLGLDTDFLRSDEGVAILAGNRLPLGAASIAMAYAGHQFGNFVPQLGDGRAILLGEVVGRDGRRRDIQLKGSGQTPFSRRGDGRAALGPVLREYIISEAMHALGIPTTRSLAAVTTGQPVYRDSVVPGAILTRVAASHIRIGTFQFLAARGDTLALRRLADHVIDRHFPSARESAQPYLALLDAVTERQARLVARWMHVGFIHGVMNTDNMAVSGETIDFGPCAFMDAYDSMTVFSSIDRDGRYAFANQPRIAHWNLARLAETLLPLINEDRARALEQAREAVDRFPETFERHWLRGMRRKLGWNTAEAGDAALVNALLDAMQGAAADYTLTFRRLCDVAEESDGSAVNWFSKSPALSSWVAAWRARCRLEPGGAPMSGSARAAAMRLVNPAIIPRNHRVEQALAAAVTRGDMSAFENLRTALEHPYDEPTAATATYADPPEPSEQVYQTFCGT